ncbi:leukotoxin LktA family filamentous adhesin [Halocynthiibacter sp. C4]|uniref:leukotoxin LktA family filamentous adhesin n=1 Tax=Halocynthiibacter sp. C4 TaxID=2992758 RepID=UPI00237B1CD7|nr:leukotoxin LktA family filamentous adhesin [Halocynthiibacter sp. C4]MDE0591503.1 leukotoxin LktA family filamentous adhesin [Halocynthiibacter sp. C4]
MLKAQSTKSRKHMPRKGRVKKQSLISRIGGWAGAVSVGLMQVLPAYADVVAVGGSGTSVSSPNGNVDVTTSNVQSGTAFNQFSEFNVGGADTVNLHQPLNAQKLVNIISGGGSQVDGIVNTYFGTPSARTANMTDVYFVNADGFVVGSTGVINAGQLTITTPTSDFVSDLIDEANGSGPITYTPTQELFLGSEPLNPDGVIDIQGEIFAKRLDLRAGARMIVDGRIDIDTNETTGQIDPAVNLQGVPTAGGVNIDANGVIRLVSEGTVEIGDTAEISAKGSTLGANEHGGLVEVIADGDITASGSIDVSNGTGDAGSVMLYTKGSARLEPAFSVVANSTGGSGGFFALRAKEDITSAGGDFDLNGSGGSGEAFLIAKNITIDNDLSTNGGSLGVSASKTATVTGATVDTAPTAGGVAGDLIITAPSITIENNAELLASSAGADNGGFLGLIARNTNTGIVWAINPESEVAEINISDATIEAGSIVISAVAKASNVFGDPLDDDLEATQVEAMENSSTEEQFEEMVTAIGNTATLALEGGLSTLNGLIPLQVQVLTADASVTITDSDITANGNWAGRNSSAQNNELEYAENGFLSPLGLREDTYRFMTAGSYFDVLLGDDNAYQMKLYLPSEWDRDADSLFIHSHADSELSISPFAYGLGLAVSVTDTKSQVKVTDSDLLTDAGNMSLVATAMENHTVNISAKKIANGAAAVVVSVRNLTNQVVVDGGTTNSAGTLDVAAFTGRNLSMTTVANSGMEGRLAIAVNVDVSNSLTEAALGGTVTAGGNVNVEAENLFFNLAHVTTATMGLANVQKVVASHRNSTSSTTGLAGTLMAAASGKPADPNRKAHFGLGVAVDLQLSDDNTYATIGGTYHDFDDLDATPLALGTTEVTATGKNVAVNASYRFADRGSEGGSGLTRGTSAAFGKLTFVVQKMLERYNAKNPANPVTEDELLGRYSDALMMNISIASLLGETQAEIGGNATINAGSLDVNSVTRFPNTNPVESLVNQWDTYVDHYTDYQPVAETGQAEPPAVEAPVAPDIAGFIELVNPLTYLTTDSKAKGEAPVPSDGSKPVVPDSEQGKAIGLTVTYFNTSNTTKSVIRDGATVNLKTEANVKASQESLFLHVVNLPKKNPLSGEAKVNDAIGAGIFVSRTVSDVIAEIESGAKVIVSEGNVNVDAITDNFVASLAYSGGQGSDVAVNATIDVQISDADTVARIGEEAEIKAEEVSIKARDESVSWSSAGAISGSENVGVGASGVVNFNTRNIWAGIGPADRTATLADASLTVIKADKLDILAENATTEITVAVAGTKVVGKPTPPANQEPPANDSEDDMIIPSWLFSEDEEDQVNAQQNVNTPADQQGQQQKSGWAVSGAAVVNLSLGSTVSAEILTNNKIDLTGDLNLTAKSTATSVNVGGAVSAGMGSAQDTNAIAGAFAVHVEDRILRARIVGAEVFADDVILTGDDQATVVNIAVGGAGTSRGDIALAGSVAVASLGGEVTTELLDAEITSEALTLDADDTSTTVSVGGAVGINMDATQGYGVGVGIAVNAVNRSAMAKVSGSGFVDTGAFAVLANSTQSIYGFAVSAGVGKTGLAGSVTVNTITSGAKALVLGEEDGVKLVVNADSAEVKAEENNTIFALGGALAGGRSTAVGAALTANVITAATEARLQDVSLSKRAAGVDLGAVRVTGNSTSTITTIAVAGAAAASGMAAGVGLSGNEITATNLVSLARSEITDAELIEATADAGRTIASLGGGIGISGKGAAGVAATLNLLLGNTTKVDLTGANLSTRDSGAISANAIASGTIRSMAAGISASSNTSIGGAVTVNVTTAETSVIANGATITADGMLTLSADDSGTVQSLAGGAALSLSGNAAGGAVAANFIDHDTKVITNGGSLTGEGLLLSSENSSTIESMAVGLAGGNGNAFSGSIAIGSIGNTTTTQAVDTDLNAKSGVARLASARTGDIDILSGSAAVGGANAVGVALTVASIHGGVSADLITSGSISGAALEVAATNTASIDALAVSGALGLGGAGGAGSVVYTQIGRPGVDGPSMPTVEGDDPAVDPIADTQTAVENERDAALQSLVEATSSNATSLDSNDLAMELDVDDVVRARVELTGADQTLPGVSVQTTETTTTRSLAGAVGIGVSSAGIGAGLAVNLMFGKTEAELILPSGEDTYVDGDIDVGITQTGTVETAGVAGGGGSSVGGAGSVTVNVMNRQADARIAGALTGTQSGLYTDGGNVDVTVTQGGTIDSLAGAVGIGGTAGFGGAITVNVMSDDAEAKVEDVTLVTAEATTPVGTPLSTAGDVTITADQTMSLGAASVAVGGGGTGAFAGSFAVNVADGEVLATQRSTNFDVKSLTLAATATPSLVGNAGAISGGGSAAVGLGIVTNVTRQTVRADYDMSETFAHGNVSITAKSNGSMSGNAISGSGSGGVALTGSGVGNSAENLVEALVRDTDVVPNDDYPTGEAPDDYVPDGGSYIGTRGSILVLAEGTNNISLLGGTDETPGISVNFAGGGTAGIGASVTVNTLANDVRTAVEGNTVLTGLGNSTISDGTDTHRGVAIKARGNSTINMVAANGAVGGVAGVAALFAMNLIKDKARVQISANKGIGMSARINDPSLLDDTLEDKIGTKVANSNQDTVIEAKTDNSALAVTANIAVGGSAGVGAGSGNTLVTNLAEVDIGEAFIGARKTVDIDALAKTKIETVTLGLAGGFVGVSANAGVNRIASEALVTLDGTGVLAGDDVLITSKVDSDSYGLTGAAGGGAIGGAGGVQVTLFDSTSKVTIGKSRAYFEGTIEAGDDIETEALTVLKTDANAVSGAVGGGALALAANISLIEATTEVNLGAGTRMDAGGSLLLRAKDEADIDSLTGSVGLGGVGIGASIDYVSFEGTTKVAIGSGAKINAYVGSNPVANPSGASDGLTIEALSERDVETGVLAVGAGFLSLAAAISAIDMGGASEGDDGNTATLLAQAQQELDADQSGETTRDVDDDTRESTERELSDEDKKSSAGSLMTYAGASGTASEVTASRQSIDLLAAPGADVVKVEIGSDAILTSRGNATINATSRTAVKQTAGGAAVSLAGGAISGTAVSNIGTGSSITMGSGARLLADGNIALSAANENIAGRNLIESNAVTVAASGGFSAGVGVSYAKLSGSSKIDLGAGTALEGHLLTRAEKVALSATRSGTVLTDTFNLSLGVAGGVGVAVSHAKNFGSSIINIGRNGGATSRILAETVTLKTDDTSRAEATGEGSSGGIAAGVNAVVITADAGSDSVLTTHALDVDARTITFENLNAATAYAEARGIAVGAVAIGAAVARANLFSTVTTAVNANLDARTITLKSKIYKGAYDHAKAISASTSGGLLAGNGAESEAYANYKVNAAYSGSFQSDGLLTFETDATAVSTRAETTGRAGGLAAIGVTIARSGQNTASSLDAADRVATVTASVNDATIAAESLVINTGNAPSAYSKADSGSGGVVSGSGAETRVTTNTATVTNLGNSGTFNVAADTVTISTGQTAALGSKVDTMSAAAIGASGSDSRTNVATAVVTRIGGNANILAKNIDITAKNTVNRPEDDWNIKSGSGGAIDVAAMVSRVGVDATTDLYVDNGAKLTQYGITGANQTFEMGTYTNMAIVDRLKLDAGGAIAIPIGESEIRINTNTAKVTIGAADIFAIDDVTFYSGGDATIKAEVDAKSYGLAGAATGSTEAIFNSDNRVIFGNGARIESLRNVKAQAGFGAREAQDVSVRAETRVFNKTAIPIPTDPAADAEANTNSIVDIQQGSEIFAVKDVYLLAEEGSRDIVGYGRGKDLYREALAALGSAFSEAFGGEPVSLDIESGTSKNISNDGILVNGYVRAGSRNKQILILNALNELDNGSVDDANGNPYTDEMVEGIAYSIRKNVLIASELQERIDLLTDLINDPILNQDAAAVLAWEAEKAQLQARAAGAAGTATFVDLEDIIASEGNIVIRADYVHGTNTGTLDAPGNAEIKVHIWGENTYLNTANMIIPENEGGRIIFNDVNVQTPQDINALSDPNRPGITNYTMISGDDAGEPRIEAVTYGGGGLIVGGDIYNADGVAHFTANGPTADLDVRGDISAKTIELSAGRDFVQGYKAGFTEIEGDPREIYESFFETHEGKARKTVLAGLTVTGYSGGNLSFDFMGNPLVIGSVSEFSIAPRKGIIQAGRNVYISADKLNINGLIQAGTGSYDVTIAADIDTYLDQLLKDGISGPVLLHNPAEPVNNNVVRNEHITSDVIIKFEENGVDADGNVTGKIVVSPMVVQGGRVELVGEVFSTGGGEIRSLDGFGTVNVNSGSKYALELGRIDLGELGELGQGVEGVVRITDTGREIRPDEFLITEFRRIGTEFRELNNLTYDVENFDFNEDGKIDLVRHNPTNNVTDSSTTSANGRSGMYQTREDRDLVINRAETVTQKTNKTQTQFFFWAGFGKGVESEKEPIQATPEPADVQNGLNGMYLADSLGGSDYAYHFSGRRVSNSYEDSDESVDDKRFLGIGDVVTTWTTTQTATHLYTHRLKADYGVKITFDGGDTGGMNVISGGDVIFTGNVSNSVGNTSVTSNNGSILSSDSSVGFNVGELQLYGYGGRIGGMSTAFRVDQHDGTALTAIARDSIDIRELGGDMIIDEVRTTRRTIQTGTGESGQVALQAEGSIFGAASTSKVTGSSISLLSTDGGIGTDTEALKIHEDGGSLIVKARNNVNITEETGNLHLNTVESQTGSVTLTSLGGAILDRNDVQVRDVRTEDELGELWTTDLGLNGAGLDVRIDEQIAALKAERKRSYEAYWRARNADGGAAQTFELDPATGQSLLDGGWSQAQLDAYIAEREALYTAWNGEAVYDASYEYDVSLAERADYLDGVEWTNKELTEWIRAGLIRGTGDTNIRIEDPNVIAAGDINLYAATEVGELLPEYVLGGNRADDLEALATAERADVIIDDVNNTITVRRAEDVNFAFTAVDTNGHSLGNLRVESAAGDLFLSAETAATLANLTTPENIRLKIDGAMTDNRDGVAAVTGSAIIVEAGNNASIGEAGNPLTFDIHAGGNLIARAGHDVFIHAIDDMLLAEVFAGGKAVISAVGAITDDVATGAVRVRAADLVLDGASIGIDAEPLVIEITDNVDGALDLETTSGDAYVTAASDLRLKKAVIAGGGRIETTGEFAFLSNNTLAFGSGATLTLIAPKGLDLSASSGTDIAGGTLIIQSGGGVGSLSKRLETVLAGLTFMTDGSDPTSLFVNDLDDLRIETVVQTHADAVTDVIAGGTISVGTITNASDVILLGQGIADGRIVAERVELRAVGPDAADGIGMASMMDLTTGRLFANATAGDIAISLRDRDTEIEEVIAGGAGSIRLLSDNSALTLLAGNGIATEGGSIEVSGTQLLTMAEILSKGGSIDIAGTSLRTMADILSEGGAIDILTVGDFIQQAGTKVDSGTGPLRAAVGGDMELAQLTTTSTGLALDLSVEGMLSVASGQTATQLVANTVNSRTMLRAGRIDAIGPDGLATHLAELDVVTQAGALHIQEADGLILSNAETQDGLIDIFTGGRTVIGTLNSVSSEEIVISSSAGNLVSDGAVLQGGDVRLFAFGGALTGETVGSFQGDTKDGVTLHLVAQDDLFYTETAGDLRVAYALSDQGNLELNAPNGSVEFGVLGAAGSMDLEALGELRVTVIGGSSVDLADEDALQLVNPEYYGKRDVKAPEAIEMTARGVGSKLYGGFINGKGSIGLHADNIDVHLNDARPSDSMLLVINDDRGGIAENVDVRSIGDGPNLFITDYFADVRTRLQGRTLSQGELILTHGRIGSGQVTHAGESFIGEDIVIGGNVWFRQRSFDLLATREYTELSTEADVQALALNGGRMVFSMQNEIGLVTIDPSDDIDGSGGSVLILNRRLGGVDLNGGQGFAYGVGVETDILSYAFIFHGADAGVINNALMNLLADQQEAAEKVILPQFMTEVENDNDCASLTEGENCA